MTQSSQWLRLKSHLLRKRKGIKSRRPRFENLERRDLLAGVNDLGPDDADASAFSRDEDVDLFFGRINAENGDGGTLTKEGSLRNVGLDLANLHSDHLKHKEMTATTVGPFKFTSRNPHIKVSDDTVVVDVLADGEVESLRGRLADVGMQITGTWQQLISGVIPIDAIDDLAALDGVRSARPFMAIASSDEAVTQGDVAQRSDELRSTLGIDGAGVTIGVLSDSFDSLGGAASDVASGDLPGSGNPAGQQTPVHVLNDNPYGDSDEGRALLQVIHDVAPGANLAFATASLGQAAFAQSISDLRTVAGADIIVDDVLYFAEPFFQDGVIAQAVDIAFANGVAYFSAAGNNGSNSYESDYSAGTFYEADTIDWSIPEHVPGAFASAPGAPPFTGGTAHVFDVASGVDRQGFTLTSGQSITLSFQWDQPFASATGGVGADPNEKNGVIVIGLLGRGAKPGSTKSGIGNMLRPVADDGECDVYELASDAAIYNELKRTIAENNDSGQSTIRVIIVGHSYGGGAGIGYAEYLDKEIKKLGATPEPDLFIPSIRCPVDVPA